MKRTIITALALALLLLAHGAPPRAQTDDRGASIWKGVAELPAREKRWALVIGVDKYQDANLSSLAGAANDARALAGALTRYAGFSERQITLLTTDETPARQPTRTNILSGLHDLAANAPKDGLLLVFFAGHGIARDDSHAYLLPPEAPLSNDVTLLDDTAINVDKMREYIRATGVRQVMIILDACRNDPVRARGGAPNLLTEAESYARAFRFDVRNREVEAFVTIYASARGQRAYEDGVRRHGYFTMALVEGMSGAAKNDRGEVTLAALVDYVQRRVPELVGSRLKQRPWKESAGFLENELVVSVAGPLPVFEPGPAQGPAESSDGGFKALDEAMRRTSPPPDSKSITVRNVLFDCLPFGVEDKNCYLMIFGGGWGATEVKVTMNGRDISQQLTSQDDNSIELKGNRESLNFINGRNELVIKAGDRMSGPYAFTKIIK